MFLHLEIYIKIGSNSHFSRRLLYHQITTFVFLIYKTAVDVATIVTVVVVAVVAETVVDRIEVPVYNQ